ncbi:ABC-F family ATP-binding cassette domain-containing protein [Nanchangia anserum]|uniref:ABC-F family ATP-binding cassette domain-containing protein n=1 Tax=Nanchangia anserum TaxID=2692125 RepID=A0A8I0KNJ9_9ACTO|nr:ATP-binding cassette domain-containing protein [Nanchangia anserum]MBD3689361.1 ABC-F family ATP-binding cassette domain-containing protein [Nanchangia anserum]QOX81567.1 ABC-F family ATP-binding cassette domain-containing protein [Nanchangia anserum]
MSVHAPLTVTHLAGGYPEWDVFRDLSFSVPAGQPTALIGDNGCGKTTLLRLLAGELPARAGMVSASGTVGYFRQESFADELAASAGDVLRAGIAADTALCERYVRACADLVDGGDDREIARLADEIDAREAWQAPERAEQMARAFRVDAASLGRDLDTVAMGELSGGERVRLRLAAFCAARCDVALLDEPTLHLDDDAIDALAAQVRSWPGVLIVASHDRHFLSHAVSTYLDFDPAPVLHAEEHGDCVTWWHGTWDEVVTQRRARDEAWRARYRRERDRITALRAAAHRDDEPARYRMHTEVKKAKRFFEDRHSAATTRIDARRAQRVREAEAAWVTKPPHQLRLDISSAPDRGVGFTLRNVEVAGRLAPVSIDVEPGEHVLVCGPNGAGKTTLLRLLGHEITPTGGHAALPDASAIASVSQFVSRRDDVDNLTVVDYARRLGVGVLDKGLVPGIIAHRRLCELSGGQRVRVNLAVGLARGAQLLLLDEPGNAIAPVVVTELEDQLRAWPATLVWVSHDRELRRRWWGRTLTLSPVQCR